MRTLTLLTLLLAACLQATGCCGPMMGPGCGMAGGNCHDCEGGFGPRQMATGPIDALRNARRSLVCGGGCSEVYYGEWTSTPPDCADPCCGSEFVGGATKCTPFCWQPGALLSGLYGRRFDDCCDTGCDSCATFDDCGSGDMIDGSGMGSSCPSCSAGMMQSGNSQVVRSQAMPRADRMTMQQTQARPAPQKQQMRPTQTRPQQQVRMNSPARPMSQQPMTRSAQLQMATEEQNLRR